MRDVSYSEIKDIKLPKHIYPHMEHYEVYDSYELNVWYIIFEILEDASSSMIYPSYWFRGKYTIEVIANIPNKYLNGIFSLNELFDSIKTLDNLVEDLKACGCRITIHSIYESFYDRIFSISSKIK